MQKWAVAWRHLARKIQRNTPKTKLLFKQVDDLFIIAQDVKLEDYAVSFDLKKQIFTLDKKSSVFVQKPDPTALKRSKRDVQSITNYRLDFDNQLSSTKKKLKKSNSQDKNLLRRKNSKDSKKDAADKFLKIED